MKLTQYLWLRQLFDADSGTYTYLLYETKTHEALLIDTVKERFLRDARLIHELGLNLRFTLDTHVHADHITAAGIFRRNFGIQTIVGDPFHVPCADLHLKDGEEIQLGQFKVKVIATPGHSGGCVSYFVEGAV